MVSVQIITWCAGAGKEDRKIIGEGSYNWRWWAPAMWVYSEHMWWPKPRRYVPKTTADAPSSPVVCFVFYIFNCWSGPFSGLQNLSRWWAFLGTKSFSWAWVPHGPSYCTFFMYAKMECSFVRGVNSFDQIYQNDSWLVRCHFTCTLIMFFLSLWVEVTFKFEPKGVFSRAAQHAWGAKRECRCICICGNILGLNA